jgi:hemolysin III
LVGEGLDRTEVLEIDTQTSLAALMGSTPRHGEAMPRLRGVSHQIAFFIAVPLGVALAISAHGAVARSAAIVFAASVAAMFGVSGLFHRIAWTPRARRWLGRLDHTMIYALIAGTYTPVGLLAIQPGWRAPILGTVWGGALIAVLTKLTWRGAPAWVTPATCVALGWIAVIVFPQIVGRIGIAGALLLLGGGLAYTTGALIYARQRPDPIPSTFGYHELFHALVIVAVICQYATVAFFVLPRA